MKKKLFLHIGFHKTGTSALQEYFAEHRDELEKTDIFYPKSFQDTFPGNVDLSWAFNNNPPAWAHPQNMDFMKILEHYRKQLDETNCDTIIISSEDFALLDKQIASIEKIKDYFKEFEVKIITYVREPVDFMLSLYSHAVRAGNIHCSFKSYIAHHYNFAAANYPIRLRPWIKVFGKNALIVRKYDKDTFFKGNLLEDFFSAIEIDIDIQNKIEKSNVGIHPWLIQAYIDISSSDIDKKKKEKKLNELLQIGLDLPKENTIKYFLDNHDLAILNNVYKVSRIKLKRDFGIDL